MSNDDFDFEVAPGIPAPLPQGETVLWQGKPEWTLLAIQAFHARKVAIYFTLIVLYQLASGLSDGQSAVNVAGTMLITSALGALGLCILSLLAWLAARSTVYTLTSQRVLMRFGIALPITLNLPYSRITAADFTADKQGRGDLPLSLESTRGISYLVQWPHVRPWQFGTPQPMLRAVADIEDVAHILDQAVSQATDPTRQREDGRSAGSTASPSSSSPSPGASSTGLSTARPARTTVSTNSSLAREPA